MRKPNIYIVQSVGFNGDEIIKVGYSNEIEKRLMSYIYHNPSTIVLKTMYKENAIALEKKLHKNFKSTYYNEWYSLSMYDELLAFLENN